MPSTYGPFRSDPMRKDPPAIQTIDASSVGSRFSCCSMAAYWCAITARSSAFLSSMRSPDTSRTIFSSWPVNANGAW
jgi:hypothetical protein